ncbi:thioredoxin domain-containing protein [Paracoccus everestensis]|uniref:hypothetical protein n=1 Tax=Paracoccus everestensis TaxID=2903900 RepID=UPI001F320629|nr:hypothetical protein [Paracoccus everestensis]
MQNAGIGAVSISSNDVVDDPQNGPDHMKALAALHGFTFLYLYAKTQVIAKVYGTECTPDFLCHNAPGELQYRGRFGASAQTPDSTEICQKRLEAMLQITETGKGPENKVPSMGCSIEWESA